MERHRGRRRGRDQGKLRSGHDVSALRRQRADVVGPARIRELSRRESKFAYGLGVYVPYGLTSQWHDDFPGRFSVLKATLSTVYVQPNIAWRLNSKWSVGGGPIIGYSSVELIQALDLSAQAIGPGKHDDLRRAWHRRSGTEFARARLKGSATALRRPGRRLGPAIREVERRPARADAACSSTTTTPTRRSRRSRRISSSAARCRATRQFPPARRSTPSSLRNSRLAARWFRSSVSTRINHPAQVQAGRRVLRLQELAARSGLLVGRMEHLQEPADRFLRTGESGEPRR